MCVWVCVCQVRVCMSWERCRSLTLLKPAFAELYNRGNTAKVFVPHVAQCNRLLHSVLHSPSLSNNAPLKRFTFPHPASVVMQFYFISLKANFSLRILLLYFALLPAFLFFFFFTKKKYPVKLSQRCAVIEELWFQSGSSIPSVIYRALHIILG